MSSRRSIATVISLSVLGFLLSILNTPALQAQGRPDLEALHQRLLPLFELDGLVYTDADERTGRLVVGVANRGLETSVRARLDRLGVSSQQVDVVLAEPIVPVVDTYTLSSYMRPLEGGLQIRWDNYLCTFGFNAVRNGVQGFIVNSHCTTKQGGVSGTKYYQPLNQTTAEFIGTEIADPSYQRGAGCPHGKVCRRSDSAFVQRDSGPTASMGSIAMTDSINSGSLTLVGSQFRIVSEGASKVGDTVNKVGRTTGWTQGRVTATCVNTGVSGTNIVQLCQDFVAAGVGPGDSSSPVFAIDPAVPGGNDVQLRGILWGSGGGVFVYSPIANIEGELGSILTCYEGSTSLTCKQH